jgi:hypothetical protein
MDVDKAHVRRRVSLDGAFVAVLIMLNGVVYKATWRN